jgi:general secretion pathway protein D
MKKSVFNSMRHGIVTGLLLVSVSTMTLSAKSCNYRAFNIKVSEEVATSEILNQLSNECSFSIVTKDSLAKEKLSQKLYGINIKQMRLEEIFDVLISAKGLDYDYDNNLLVISGLKTKTFKIDYVNTERSGVSNTDISLTGETGESGGGEEGGKGGSLSTGATITSSDNFSFWKNMEAEITSILNATEEKSKIKPIINREAGLVTVTGTSEQINRVSAYIHQMMKRLHRQVLIDVKMLSVTLDNSRQTGVNWGEIYKLQNMQMAYEILNTNNLKELSNDKIEEFGDNNPAAHATFIRLSGNTGITDVVKFLKTQGDVTAISNPKVVTLNNQPAVFSSGDQLYYKLSSSSRQTGSNAATETFNNEIVKSVFAGILLDITPEITDDDEIILKINPSISSVKSRVKTDESGVRRLPPDLMKKQISSVVKLRDGEKVILGGLISSKKGVETSKVPILGNIPLLGYAFQQKKVSEIREELIVIITPHIIKTRRIDPHPVSLKDLGYEKIKY